MTNGLAGRSKTSSGCRPARSAVVHDDDAVGQLERLFLIVRDEDARQVNLFVQPAQPARSSWRTLASSAPNGSSSSSTLRLDGERAGQRHALALAAGSWEG